MITFVLAGVFGSVLAVGEAAAGSDQAKTELSGGPGAAVAARVVVEPSARASASYKRLFAGPVESGAPVGPHLLIRFGQKRIPDAALDSADGSPCRLVEPSDQKDIDPGIFAPLRDPQIDFKIKRIVPKGCIDPGIFIPKRKK